VFAHNELPRQTRSRLWANRLWLLSAVLGMTTLGATAAIIHDASRQTAAAHVVVRATSHQVVAAAADRLENLAIQTFAPVAPWEPGTSSTAAAELEALAKAQDASAVCQCRDTLPADAFFRVDMSSGDVDIRRRGVHTADSPSVPADALRAIGRANAGRPRIAHHANVHLVIPATLGGRGVVTIVRADAQGRPVAVYGLVGNAREITRVTFPALAAVGRPSDGESMQPPLDSSSLEIKTEGSATPIFGSLDERHALRATALAKGPLEGLVVTAGLTRGQAIHSLFVSQRELWHLGGLTLATIFAIVLAIGSSRREVLLARTRSDFIAGVSHDLRMPLAQILIASETLSLRREKDDRERLRLSSSIVREARRLMSIVDNVLLFSRSGAVALKPRLEPLAIRTLFDDVLDAVSLAVDDAGQTIDADDHSLAILGDRQLLRQALVNLVDNALKYGKPRQRIRLVAEEIGASTVRLAVEDEGPGVPESERARIFEPYERLDRDQTSERTGTGLGLAVVRHIAQVCGGRVWIDDAYTNGTRAVIELPASALKTTSTPERQLV
jgi:signal transduction histidine kinase